MANSGNAVAPKPPFEDVLKPAGKSHTSSRAQKQGKICYIEVFKLRDLPDIMDKKGWKVAATLMRKWLASPARAMTIEEKPGHTDCRDYPRHLVDTTTVTMAWVLSFARVKREYDAIFGSRSFFRSTSPEYESPKAKAELVHKLAKIGKFTWQVETFGNLRGSVLDINEECQFQVHKVDDLAAYTAAWAKDAVAGDPELDDMFGALARFTLKIAGEGTVTPKTRIVDTGLQCKAEVEYYDIAVSRIGVYARDTYDFEEDQYLGHWSKTAEPYVRLYGLAYEAGDRSPAGKCPNDFVCVENANFRKHRELTGKGGDLLIFSDVLVTPLKRPFTFRVTPAEIAAATNGAK